MPRRPTPSDKLRDELIAVRADPRSPAAQELLRKGLASASSLVVEVAAHIVGEAELDTLVPLLPPRFQHFLDGDVVKRDPGCRAKVAIVQALCKLRVPADDVFHAGIRHRQLEPSFGPPVDTAAALRGHCAMGLALVDDPAAPVAIAELLADPEPTARSAAIQALTLIPPAIAEPLLRYKIRAGDAEPQVVGDGFRSLLAIAAPASAIPAIAAHLDAASEEVAEQAALALGESRLPEAFARLRELADSALGSRRRVALLAIALLRTADGRDYLVERLAAAEGTTATHVLEALAIFRHEEPLRARVLALVERRADAKLVAAARDLMKP